MLTLHAVLADRVLFNVSMFNWHIAVTLSQVIFWVIAALVGLVAEFIVGWRLPLGILGAFFAAILGMWLLTDVIVLVVPGDPNFFGVPLIKSLIGAILMVALWHFITYRSWHQRRRYTRTV